VRSEGDLPWSRRYAEGLVVELSRDGVHGGGVSRAFREQGQLGVARDGADLVGVIGERQPGKTGPHGAIVEVEGCRELSATASRDI
jgi:hypothetical protein